MPRGADVFPMRVTVIGASFFPDSMEAHIVDALKRLGCETHSVVTRAVAGKLGPLAGHVVNRIVETFVREPERLCENRIVNAVQRFSPALILVCQGKQVSPKTIARLRTVTHAPIFCWCQDALINLGRQYVLGAGYDAVFLKDRYMQDLFSRMVRSTSFIYLAEACNPRVHKPVELTADDHARYGCDVMIAGSLYYYRQEILRHLGEFDLRIWGSTVSWFMDQLPGRHMGREVVMEEKARAAGAARIAVNPLHYAEIDSLNCRAFELAGCGAFQLVTARPCVAEHFIPGEEIETFASTDELVDKIRHFLKHPDQARAIARRGRTRAHHEHTYEHRLSDIFRHAGVTLP